MTETVAVRVADVYYDIKMHPPSAIDGLVDWLRFGRREQPKKPERLRIGPINLRIRSGVVFGLSVSHALLRSKLFASIEGREAPAAGEVVVSGKASSAPRIRREFTPQLSVTEALMAGLLVDGGDVDDAKRRLEAAFLFAGMLDLAFVKIQDISEVDRARLAVAACLFREADIFLLDEISLLFNRPTLDKIYGRAALLAASGRTVILASSDEEWLKNNCAQVANLNSLFKTKKTALLQN
jgi:ABC-type polysaccharide/polyol phosphate transport system ATPase subunit